MAASHIEHSLRAPQVTAQGRRASKSNCSGQNAMRLETAKAVPRSRHWRSTSPRQAAGLVVLVCRRRSARTHLLCTRLYAQPGSSPRVLSSGLGDLLRNQEQCGHHVLFHDLHRDVILWCELAHPVRSQKTVALYVHDLLHGAILNALLWCDMSSVCCRHKDIHRLRDCFMAALLRAQAESSERFGGRQTEPQLVDTFSGAKKKDEVTKVGSICFLIVFLLVCFSIF